MTLTDVKPSWTKIDFKLTRENDKEQHLSNLNTEMESIVSLSLRILIPLYINLALISDM